MEQYKEKELIEKYFGGANNIQNYLQRVNGKRFALVNNCYGSLELFDKETMHHGSYMNNMLREKQLNLNIVDGAFGDVLICGFGIGLIILPIMNKEEVFSIDIIELNAEVIELIASQLPLNYKVKIIHADAYSYVPTRKYDTIIVDTIGDGLKPIWQKEGRKRNGKEIDDIKLSSILKRYLKKGGHSVYWEG